MDARAGVGRLGGVSWTRLTTTAKSPTTIMTFAGAVDWVGGDKVVIATRYIPVSSTKSLMTLMETGTHTVRAFLQ